MDCAIFKAFFDILSGAGTTPNTLGADVIVSDVLSRQQECGASMYLLVLCSLFPFPAMFDVFHIVCVFSDDC